MFVRIKNYPCAVLGYKECPNPVKYHRVKRIILNTIVAESKLNAMSLP